MSGAPAITVDPSGYSYVSYATGSSGGIVNLTTVKRDSAGTLQWAEVNTLTATGTIYTPSEVASLFSQPDAIDTSGNAAPTPTQITQTIVPPAQTYSSFFDAALPLAATLNVQVVGGSTVSVTVPAGTEVENVKTLKLTNSGSSSISGGVATVNIGTPASSPFAVDVWYAGKNSGRTGLAPNKKRISGLQFIAAAGPSAVTINLITATAYTMTVPYTQPTYVYDNTGTGGVRYTLGEAGAPTFGNYTITATPTDTAKRWSGATTSAVTGSTAGLSRTLTGLSPDIGYTVTVTASNSLGVAGPAATTTKRTLADSSLVPTYLNGVVAPFTTDLPGVQLYSGSDPVDGAVVKTLTGGKWTQTLPPIGIHHGGNTGSAEAGIMTFGAQMGSDTETTLAFGGFGRSAPGVTTGNNWDLSSGAIADVSSGIASGYYLQVPITLSYSATGGVESAQTVTLRQNLAGVGDTTIPVDVWWDGTETGTQPTISITDAAPDTTSYPLTQVCGTYYWGGNYGFTGVDVSFNGMGTHLARADPIKVSVADIVGDTLFSNLSAPIGSSQTGGSITKTGGDTYYRDYTMTVTGTNLHGISSDASAVFAPTGGFPIIDPAGVALWKDISGSTPPTLGADYAVGRRVKTFTADSGGTIAAYDNTTSLATVTAEAIISKGYFCVPGCADAYIKYPSGADYSTITTGSGGFTSGYRYATLEWAGRPVADSLRSGFIGVQIVAPTGVLTLNQDVPGDTNMSTASISDKLKDSSGNFVDLYFNVKWSNGLWSGWKDLNANDQAVRKTNSSITSGAQSTDANKTATSSTANGVDTFQIFGILPAVPSGYQESSILIAAGGKGVTTNGAAFKLLACYKTF